MSWYLQFVRLVSQSLPDAFSGLVKGFWSVFEFEKKSTNRNIESLIENLIKQ